MIKGNKKYLFFALGAIFAFASTKTTNAAQVKGTWELKDGIWKYYDASHNMYKGWVETKDGWYYLDKDTGAMATGWKNIDGSLYYFDASGEGIEGKMHTGWYKSPEGNWYFFNNDATSNKVGIVRQGWQWIDGYCYYFGMGANEVGKMYAGQVTPDGFKTNTDGQWIDDNGVAKYEAGKGYNTKIVSIAKKTVVAPRSGGGGGGGSRSYYAPTPKVDVLADGTWFGTGHDDFYGKTRGTAVVEVVIEGGKIKTAKTIRYRNDKLYTRGQKILNYLIGLSDISEVHKKLNESAIHFDGVSGATGTAKGQLSAVDNALARAKKYSSDGKEQTIEYMEFKTRPASLISAGKLDLTQTVITVKEKGKEAVDVPYEDFAKYGIVAEPANGTDLLEQGKETEVHFKNADNLQDIYTGVYVKKELIKRVPGVIRVTYDDSTTADIAIKKDDFRYRLKAEKGVTTVELYDGDTRLSAGKYDEQRNEWTLSLKDVEVGAGYTSWAFADYVLAVDAGQDRSELKEFDLVTRFVKESYNVGETFNMDRMIISYTTEKGSKKKYNDWGEASRAGFTATMDGKTIEKGHEFTEEEAGEKDIVINSKGNKVTKIFKIRVVNTKDRIPAKVEIYDEGNLVETYNLDKEAYEKAGRKKTVFLELLETYKADFVAGKFTTKVYNSSNTEISGVNFRKMGNVGIQLVINRQENDDNPSTLTLGLKFTKKAPAPVAPPEEEPKNSELPKENPQAEEPTEKTVEAEEEVTESKQEQIATGVEEEDAEDTDFDYRAKVTVVVNPKTKTIISVADRGTTPEVADASKTKENRKAWKKLKEAFWNSFKGKTLETLDSVDSVSGATRSRKAIITAVKKALNEAFGNN